MVKPMAEVEEIATRAVEEARRHMPVLQALIFGSYVEGHEDEWSDIDLAIFSPEVDEIAVERYLDICHAIRKSVDYEVDAHLYGENHLRNARPSNFAGHILKVGKRIA